MAMKEHVYADAKRRSDRESAPVGELSVGSEQPPMDDAASGERGSPVQAGGPEQSDVEGGGQAPEPDVYGDESASGHGMSGSGVSDKTVGVEGQLAAGGPGPSVSGGETHGVAPEAPGRGDGGPGGPRNTRGPR